MQILLRKEDLRDTLGISLATVNNWIKTGIIPAPDISEQYTPEQFDSIVSSIKNGDSKLKGRANRSQSNHKLISYLGITDKKRKKLLEEVVSIFESSGYSILEGVVALSISLLKSNTLYDPTSKIFQKIESQLCKFENPTEIEKLFEDFKINNIDDDFLGAFYQSIQSISAKSNLGSYYTPSELLKNIKIPLDAKVIDPCCGSGGILLRILDKKHNPNLIWARDIDKTALYICAINLVLFFNDPNIEPNIEYTDIVFENANNLFQLDKKQTFDYVITNPPWGSKLSKLQKDLLIQIQPELQTTEVFSVALKKGLEMLSESGELVYFLPYSILNVGAHRNIRKYILKDCFNVSVRLLGNAFKGVLSESILLRIKNTNEINSAISIENKLAEQYLLNKSQVVSPDYIIQATASNIDEEIIKHLYNLPHCSLVKDTDFALGIVTGDNKKHLLADETQKTEPIYRGKDVMPYSYLPPSCFIEFEPETYQQVAPLEYFRSRKIVYRFISDKIICALDESGSMILNSANLFISHNYPMETIVCLFNSCIYTFLFRKKFHSKKVLKAHLQQLPLPILSKEQHDLFYELHGLSKNKKISQSDIDVHIREILLLNEEQYHYIKESVNENS